MVFRPRSARDKCHPRDAHDPSGEQRRHQRPAAPDAPGAGPEHPSVPPRTGRRATSRAAARAGCGISRGRRPSAASTRRRRPQRASPPAIHRPVRSHASSSLATGHRPRKAIASRPLDRSPRDEVAGGEQERRKRRARHVIRAYSATVGATDGNIIAAIITTQTPRNQPNAPSEVHGPSSVPAIRLGGRPPADPGEGEEPGDEPEPGARGRKGREQARRRRHDRVRARSRSRAQAARRTRTSRARSCPRTGCRTLIRERFARHREIGRHGVEHAGESHRLAGLDAEGHDVLDLEVDCVPDAHAVTQPIARAASIFARSTPSISPTSGASPPSGRPAAR